MKNMKKILVIIGIIVGCLLFLFSIQYLGIVNYKFFAPKQENVRREVYENTQSYVEAKRQAITKYYQEWRKASPEEKETIKQLVLQEFSNFDLNKFNMVQLKWYKDITD